MTVHVDNLETEVVAEPEPGARDAREEASWEALERLRALRRRVRLERERVADTDRDDR